MATTISSAMRSNVSVLIILFSVSLLLYVYLHFSSEITVLKSWNAKLEADVQLLNRNPRKAQISNVGHKSFHSNGIFDDAIIIYNRVPKTASTSFMGIAYDLCSKNKFNVLHINTTKNAHTLTLADQRRFVENITTWDAKKPALYHGHLAFIDFNRFSMKSQPIYINIIRKPLDRLVSYYYFLRYGDDYRPHLKRRRKGNTETFDECVRKKGKDCDPVGMWMQIPFFCGHASECWAPGSRWALEQAKHNLIHNFLVVGVMEELEDFIALLEYTLPEFFHGALRIFQTGRKSHLRKTSNKSDPLMKTIKTIHSSEIWQLENEFYEFALDHFHLLRNQMLVVKDDLLVDKGQMFRYEKIRPK